MFKELLSKNVTLTVKDLVISGVVGIGGTALIFNFKGFLQGIKHGNKSLRANVKELDEEIEDYKKEITKRDNKIQSLRDEIGVLNYDKLTKLRKCGYNEFYSMASAIKGLEESDKLLLIDEYRRINDSAFGNHFIWYANKDNYDKTLGLINQLDILYMAIIKNDINQLKIRAKQIHNENAIRDYHQQQAEENAKVEAQRAHELRLEQEQTKRVAMEINAEKEAKELEADTKRYQTSVIAGTAAHIFGKKDND